jgi:hypothetical protein
MHLFGQRVILNVEHGFPDKQPSARNRLDVLGHGIPDMLPWIVPTVCQYDRNWVVGLTPGFKRLIKRPGLDAIALPIHVVVDGNQGFKLARSCRALFGRERLYFGLELLFEHRFLLGLGCENCRSLRLGRFL